MSGLPGLRKLCLGAAYFSSKWEGEELMLWMLLWLWWKNLLKEESFAAFPRSDSGYVCLISSGSSQQPWRCMFCPWLLPSGLCGLHCPRGTQISMWFVDAGAGTFCSWAQIQSELWRPRPWTGSGSRLKTPFSFLKCNAYSHLNFCVRQRRKQLGF